VHLMGDAVLVKQDEVVDSLCREYIECSE